MRYALCPLHNCRLRTILRFSRKIQRAPWDIDVLALISYAMDRVKNLLIKGGAWAFSGKVVTALAGLAVNALLARLLTPEEMGVYFLTFSLVSVSAVVAQLGLNQTVVRIVAESMGTGRPGRARRAVVLVFRYGGLGALLMAAVLGSGLGAWMAIAMFDAPLMVGIVGLAAIWVVIITFHNLIVESFRSFHDIRLATIFGGLITSVLSACLFATLWVLQGHADLRQVITLSLVAGGTSTLIAGALLWGKVRPIRGEGKLPAKELLHIAWPLWVTGLILFVLTHADLWILGMFRPQEEVAIYGAATKLVTLVIVPLLIVNAVVPPLIAEMYAQNKKAELERSLRTTATLAGLPAFVVLVLFVLGGAPILGLVFGDFYRAGSGALAILSVGQLVNVWAGSCGLTLMMTGFHKAMMGVTIACGAITVALALILVGSLGTVGVASASTTGMVLQNILMWWVAKAKVNVRTHVALKFLPSLKMTNGVKDD